MTAIVTGKGGDEYLVDLGDGSCRIYDSDYDILYPRRDVATLAAQGERALHGYAVPACIRTARLTAGCVSVAP
jgi:hypothetical protein